jgi:hypothetical protein
VDQKSCGGERELKIVIEAVEWEGCPLPPERPGREWALRMRRNLLHGFVEAGRFLGGRRGGESLGTCTQSESSSSEDWTYYPFGHGSARLTMLEAKG